MLDRRFPHLSRLEDRPMWLSSDEATRARAFAKKVCDRTPSLHAAWNNHKKAIYFYYGGDCQQAAFTYEIAGSDGMYAPLAEQDVEDLMYALHHGRMSVGEKDKIAAENDRVEAKRRAEGFEKIQAELTPEIDKTIRARDQERRGVKKIIVG